MSCHLGVYIVLLIVRLEDRILTVFNPNHLDLSVPLPGQHHLALAIGLHRKRRKDTSDNLDTVEAECGKRVFWCAYNKYLSVALGRPRSFHDDDINQELPACVNDSDITSGGIKPRSPKIQSVMLAPVYHARL